MHTQSRLAIGVFPGVASTLLRVAGELDLSTVPFLRAAVNEVLDNGSPLVRVDASRISFIDATGLSALEDAGRSLSNLGRSLVFESPSLPVVRLIEVVESLSEVPEAIPWEDASDHRHNRITSSPRTRDVGEPRR